MEKKITIIYKTVCGTSLEEVFPSAELSEDSQSKGFGIVNSTDDFLEMSAVFSVEKVEKMCAELEKSIPLLNQYFRGMANKGANEGFRAVNGLEGKSEIPDMALIPQDHQFISLTVQDHGEDGVTATCTLDVAPQ